MGAVYGLADLSRIVGIQLGSLARRLEERRLELEVAPAAAEWLAERGYDPAFGARPLRRTIQREIGDRLAVALLEGRYSEGDTVRVTVESGELALS